VSFAVSLHAFSLWCFLLLLQVVDYLVDPFVAGTSGADPDSISVGLSPVLLFGHVWLILLRLNHHSNHTTSAKSIVVVYKQCRK
jgi:hypothetical protein